jgi:hypothetical protein
MPTGKVWMETAEQYDAERLREDLRSLHVAAGQPTLDNLEAHSGRLGFTVSRSALHSVLTGPSTPRWATVQAFVAACERFDAKGRRALQPGACDLSAWKVRHDGCKAASNPSNRLLKRKLARRRRQSSGLWSRSSLRCLNGIWRARKRRAGFLKRT